MVRMEQKVLPFIQKRSVDLLRGLIGKTVRVEDIRDLLPLLRIQGPEGEWTFLRFQLRPTPLCPMTIDTGSGNPNG